MDALQAITTRHSTRSYDGRPVERDVLEQIVDAGRLAATGCNEQPWEFVVVTDAEARRAIAQLTDYGKFIADAGACIVVVCKDATYYLEDGSAATQNMLVAAAALGVQSCWVCGDKKAYGDPVMKLLGAPAGHKLVSLVALGYAARQRPRAAKRPLGEVMHWEKF